MKILLIDGETVQITDAQDGQIEFPLEDLDQFIERLDVMLARSYDHIRPADEEF